MNRLGGMSLAILILIGLFTGVMLADNAESPADATSPEAKAYADASEEWCDDRGGLLVNVQSVYKGGLHCQLDNGTWIRMADIDPTTAGEQPSEPDAWSVEAGSETPREWREGDITVAFDQVQGDEWEQAYSTTVAFGEEFDPVLDRGERYRIVVESHTGERRFIGTFEYTGEPETLYIFICCGDSFGGDES